METLFVYGIFLGDGQRANFGMANPRYATVRDYATWASSGNGYIVTAYSVPPEYGMALTGLLVDIAPAEWPSLDRLEQGYDRVQITTTTNQQAYMYVGRSDDESNGQA